MSAPILATKLYAPPTRPEFIARPRLIERLNEGLYRKLTLVSAPAGFGKTTLVSEWINQNNEGRTMKDDPMEATLHNSSFIIHPSKVAWLSLDDGDNDLTRFLTYLVAALQTIAPILGERALVLLQSSQPPPIEAMLTTLLNDITTIPDPFILVLDDYHVIEDQPVDQALTFLLDHLPPQMHLVIATREDPPLPLARYRARGQLTELRTADLRFIPDEAAGFLNQVMGLNLSAEAITTLETRTEGWIAGLQLAALSIQGHQDATSFITSFTGSHRFVMDYLVEEVLQQQPERVQRFLLHTSILDRLCGPLCDAVLPAPDISGQETLEYLERANLLVVPLDNQRQWYRYHHLFGDVLQARLMKEQPHQVAELHQRASEWYEQHGLPADAIRHALAVEDFERAARLVELAWSAIYGSFQTTMFIGWVQILPAELVRARPVLSVGYALALLIHGKFEIADDYLKVAERWLDANTDTSNRPASPSTEMVVVDEEEFRLLPATIATARTFYAQALGDVPSTVTYARQALNLLPAENHLRRGPAAALLGLAQWRSGDLEAAHRALTDAVTGFQKVGNIVFAISGTYGLADIRLAQGRLREAISIYEQSLQLAMAQGEPAIQGTADLYLGLSDLCREQGDLETARQHLLKSQALSEQAALPDWPCRVRVIQARMKQTLGDLDGALTLLDEAERLYYRTPIPDVQPIAALKTRVWVRQGRLAEALAWARERGLSVDDDLTYLGEFEYVTLARILIAQYRHDQADHTILEARGLLARLLKAAEVGGRTGSAIEILMLQALAHQAQGDTPAALMPLQQALTLAEPEGYVHLFVDEGLPMAELLSAVTAQGILSDYVDQLLATFSVADLEKTPSSKSHSPNNDLVEPLSERELEVLQLIAEGLSNQEIAARLYLSLNTIKVHTRNIYGKLGVRNRTHAVAQARVLGILPAI